MRPTGPGRRRPRWDGTADGGVEVRGPSGWMMLLVVRTWCEGGQSTRRARRQSEENAKGEASPLTSMSRSDAPPSTCSRPSARPGLIHAAGVESSPAIRCLRRQDSQTGFSPSTSARPPFPSAQARLSFPVAQSARRPVAAGGVSSCSEHDRARLSAMRQLGCSLTATLAVLSCNSPVDLNRSGLTAMYVVGLADRAEDRTLVLAAPALQDQRQQASWSAEELVCPPFSFFPDGMCWLMLARTD